jgi:hypothetical protein
MKNLFPTDSFLAKIETHEMNLKFLKVTPFAPGLSVLLRSRFSKHQNQGSQDHNSFI